MKTEILNKKLGISLIILAMVLSTIGLMAQKKDHKKPPPIPDQEQIEKMMADLSNRLSLTEKQENKILILYKDHFNEVSKKMEENKNSGKDGREQIKIIRENFEKDVKSLLTPEQQKQFDEFVREKRSERGKKPGRKKGR